MLQLQKADDFFRPVRALRAVGLDEPDSFESIQRERFLLANLIAVAVGLVMASLHSFMPRVMGDFQHFIGPALVIGSVLFVQTTFRWRRIEQLCRIWLGVTGLVLWGNAQWFAGGVIGYTAPLLVLLPVAAALLLHPRDIVAATLFSLVAIASIGIGDIAHAPKELYEIVLTDVVLLMVGTLGASATVLTLAIHQNKVDEKRLSLLRIKEYVACHDGLTGLINRTTIGAHLSQLQPGAQNHNLFLLDVDGFKEINDGYGHHIGDQLLIKASKRIMDAVPPEARVARLGGDEFLVLVPADERGNTMNWPSGKCPGTTLVEKLREPFHIESVELQISASVGVAHFPADADNGDVLLKRADLALYAAKKSGRNQCRSFRMEMETAQTRHLVLQNNLRAALTRGDIFVEYQPQFRLSDGTLSGFEALARWHDEALGLVSPDKFVPIAEECGLIIELGEQVLRQACEQALTWARLKPRATPLKLSVNVSTIQLNALNIVQRIKAILDETGFPANRLELEITESVLITNPEKTMATLDQLAGLGITIAMDDFGKGYSSLSYLQNFSLARLKIDRSFISRLHHPNGTSIVRSIIQLAKAMDLSVVAEGVETEIQYQTLRQLGCDYGQGFLYAPSLQTDGVKELILASEEPRIAIGAPIYTPNFKAKTYS